MVIICWDYDGTLVSSELIYKNIFVNFLKNEGVILKNIDDKYYFSQYAGKHPLTVLNHLKNDGFIDRKFEISVDRLNNLFQEELRNSNSLLITDGMDKILSRIACCKSTLMAIVTSTYRGDFESKHNNKSVALLRDYFNINDNVYICGEVGNRRLKPDPNGYLFACDDIVKKHNLINCKNTVIMVEDSISGCIAASTAKQIFRNLFNIKVVGYLVANKYLHSMDLKNVGADIVIKNYENMLDFLEKTIEESD